MGLVDDQRVIAQQASVALDLGEQDAVGHQLDQRSVARVVVEAHRIPDGVAKRNAQLVGDPLRDGAGGQPARLRVADGAANPAAELEADLGQLRRLARTGLASDDDHLMLADRFRELITHRADGQIGIGNGRHGRTSGGDQRLGRDELFDQLVGHLTMQTLEPAAEPRRVPQRQPVKSRTQLWHGRLGHSSKDMSPDAWQAWRMTSLADQKFVSLTTFKKNGDGVAGPMWIAGDGDHLVVWTPADSWKVKRARRDPRVTLVPCSQTGKVSGDATRVEGTAEVVTDPAAVAAVRDAIKRKYGLMFHVMTTIERIAARGAKPRAVLRITLT